MDAPEWRHRNNKAQGRILRCNGHKCCVLPKKIRKAKIKCYIAGADDSADAMISKWSIKMIIKMSDQIKKRSDHKINDHTKVFLAN